LPLRRASNRVHQFRRRAEIGVQRIADIQHEDGLALPPQFIGDRGQIADGRADVLQVLGYQDFERLRGEHDSGPLEQFQCCRSGGERARLLAVPTCAAIESAFRP